MPIDFPNSPSASDTFSAAGKTWVYDGTTWNLRVGNAGAGSITTTELADGSVTTAKIAANAVVEADIANDAVTTNKIATVTGAKLASNAVVSHLGYTPANAATAASTGKSIAMAIVFGG